MVWPGWTTCRCVLVSYPSTPIARSPRLASPRFLTRHRRRRDPRRRRPHPLMAAARRWAAAVAACGARLSRRRRPEGHPQLPAAAAAPVEGLLDAPSLPPPVAVAAAGRRRRRRSPAPPSSSGTPRCGHLLLSPSCRCSGRLWNAVEEVLPCLLPNWGMLGRKPFLGRLCSSKCG